MLAPRINIAETEEDKGPLLPGYVSTLYGKWNDCLSVFFTILFATYGRMR